MAETENGRDKAKKVKRRETARRSAATPVCFVSSRVGDRETAADLLRAYGYDLQDGEGEEEEGEVGGWSEAAERGGAGGWSEAVERGEADGWDEVAERGEADGWDEAAERGEAGGWDEAAERGEAGGWDEVGRSGRPCLRVVWDNNDTSVRVEWTESGRRFSWAEDYQALPIRETAENRCRRLLRLAIFRLFEAMSGDSDPRLSAAAVRPGPWGGLTGVRPMKILRRLLDQGLGEEAIRRVLPAAYGIRADRVGLLLDTGEYQRPYLPTAAGRERISLYFCYPFCPSRCDYCSFPGYETGRWRKWQGAYHAAALREIGALGQAARERGLVTETVYFGGGTPTAMPPEALAELLAAVTAAFAVAPGAEWTVESGRPETLTPAMLDVLAAGPVSRLCINPQTMRQSTLDAIGRRHQVEAVYQAFAAVKAYRRAAAVGADGDRAGGQAGDRAGQSGRWLINSDLILGLPGEDLAAVSDSLARLIALAPDNITIHGLALKRGSAYKERPPDLPGGDEGLAMTDFCRTALRVAGYAPYYLYRQKDSLGGENVGYCLPGRHSLYNIYMIEERQTILGLGAGAGSKFLAAGDWSLENFYNPKDMIQYIERLPDLIRRKIARLPGTQY
ncbi:MAG: radical SAM protein [Peptococcaceae bacterium]|jgi:oxygen-independent coproporphyrinogen-3 oxidase|nr:radical SAM protein [Peptococcaceae bacterium]